MASLVASYAAATAASFRWPWQAPPPPPPPPPAISPMAYAGIGCAAIVMIIFAVRRLWKKGANGDGVKDGETAPKKPQGAALVALICFLLVTSMSVTMPFASTRRDQLNCDSLCQGSRAYLRLRTHRALTCAHACLHELPRRAPPAHCAQRRRSAQPSASSAPRSLAVLLIDMGVYLCSG